MGDEPFIELCDTPYFRSDVPPPSDALVDPRTAIKGSEAPEPFGADRGRKPRFWHAGRVLKFSLHSMKSQAII